MRAPALADAATQLPWLSPGAASLRALAQAPAAEVWPAVRHDPGCVLLILRQAAASQAASALSFFPALVRDPAVLEGAVYFLDQQRERAEPGTPRSGLRAAPGFVNWNEAPVAPIYHASLTFARLAWQLADQTGRCDPENAWVAGLLAPLGWLAVAAIDPAQAAACLADTDFPQDGHRTQERWWGLDHAAIARRLALRWQLPRWLAVVPGGLGLPLTTAKGLGADPDLFSIVQLAVRLAQQGESPDQRGALDVPPTPLHLAIGATTGEAANALGLSLAEATACRAALADRAGPCFGWESPQDAPLLRDLLCLAAENRRLANSVTRERLQRDVDTLHRALESQIAGEAQRLQAQKLSALAEFAAGAGHEINNPLAVISGQAQYLLGHLRAESRLPQDGSPESASSSLPGVSEKALETIIAQTRRIHHLLTDLMQFARPPRPYKRAVDVGTLIREVAASLQDLAVQRQVRLLVPEGFMPLTLDADYQQVATSLTCLLRNAIEAAPPDGWAAVRLETPTLDRVDLLVEDNGSGPPPAQRDHLFDPFYSGRSAGRGRGLGLATAWRFARENGGDVRFDSPPAGPTRFVLSLPTARSPELPCRDPASAFKTSKSDGLNPEPLAGTNGLAFSPRIASA